MEVMFPFGHREDKKGGRKLLLMGMHMLIPSKILMIVMLKIMHGLIQEPQES